MVRSFVARVPGLVAVLSLCSGLAACGFPPVVAVVSYAADGISYVATGKSIADHAISEGAEQDCAVYRVFVGGDICRAHDREMGDGIGEPVLVTDGTAPYDIHGDLLDETGEDFYLIEWRRSRLEARSGALQARRARVRGLAGDARIFAQILENGALEIYGRTAAQARRPPDVTMLVKIFDYADDPESFAGVEFNGAFHTVEELTGALDPASSVR